MSLQTNLISTGKEKAAQITAFLEELELQMALGKAEARDAIEREQKTFRKFINQQKSHIRHTTDAAEEHRLDLSRKFNALEAVLSKDLPHSKRKFDAAKKQTLTAIYELEDQLKTAYGDVNLSLQQQLDKFKTKLDGYRVKLALSNVEDEVQLQNRKVELQKAINSIQEKINEESEARGKVDHFVEEVSESFDHMKKAFSELFS